MAWWHVAIFFFTGLSLKGHECPSHSSYVFAAFAAPACPSPHPGKYVDKKCPFTGNVSIRGRILSGVVKTTKMKRTIVIRRDYLHYISKYNRFEKRHSTLPAHCSPAFLVREGQKVVVGQCRYVWLT
jgi:ribosomal protein S17